MAEHGHAFLALLKGFKEATEPVIGVDVLRQMSKLRALAEKAMKYDGYIAENYISPPEAAEWVKEAERVIGQLTALAIYHA